jgi:hypothetical protein
VWITLCRDQLTAHTHPPHKENVSTEYFHRNRVFSTPYGIVTIEANGGLLSMVEVGNIQ